MMKQNMGMTDGDEIVRKKGNCWTKCRAKGSSKKKLAIVMTVIIFLLLLAIILYFALRSRAEDEMLAFGGPGSFRLPGNVIPSHYVLEVQVYMTPENFSFEGSVQIYFKCNRETNIVIFHSKGLFFIEDDIRINSGGSSRLKIRDITFSTTNDYVILKLIDRLNINADYLLFVKYNGKMSSDDEGLYYSSYTDKSGITRYTANTQLEPVHARKVFPCFDEPEFKATFDITIVRGRNLTSLSNMPKIRTEDRGSEWVADKYLTTLKMSTYLVAFAVGEYVGIKEDKVAIWAPKGLSGETSKFALDISVKLLKLFEDLLNVSYEPPKLDMAAVMKLSGEAMENWGLVIALKSYLLTGSGTDVSYQKKRAAQTIAHEIAHQWFGNLVTMKWWSDLWLNEGLASYMEEISLRYFLPELQENPLIRTASTLLFSKDCCPASESNLGIPGIYGEDCSDFSGHITSTVWKNVTRANDLKASTLFDEIVYYKGSTIVAMVHHVLGNETFWKFLTKYLKQNAYGNVDEAGFWGFVSEAQSNGRYTRFDMSKMTTWTHLPGIPILSVKRNYKENSAIFSQESCRRIDSRERDLWNIPVSYRTSKNGKWDLPKRIWMSQRHATISNMPSEDDWIMANDESSESYIVNYDKHNWQLLASQLKKNHTVFTPRQRYKILADAVNLFRLNYSDTPIDAVLSVSSYLGSEREWHVFEKPNRDLLLSLQPLMIRSTLKNEWKEFMTDIFGPMYDEYVRGNGTSFVIRTEELQFWLCRFNYSVCVEDALRIAEGWRDGTLDDAAMMKKYSLKHALCIAARESPSFSDYLYEEYEKHRGLVESLLCSCNASIIERLIEINEKSRNPSFLGVLLSLLDNEEHWPMVFQYIDKHFLRFTNNIRTYSEMMSLFQFIRDSPVQAEMLVEIMKRHLPNVGYKHRGDIRERIETLEINIPKMAHLVSNIENWLTKGHWRT